tara:strand:+ start:5349 stop:5738 length:390 start_codon:yes stop_codon:yes gene_type:complete
MILIQCSSKNIATIREFVKEGRKIKAIKLLRATGRIPGNGDKIGLREAKDAVERLSGQRPDAPARIVPSLRILSFKIECEEGVVEVDLDGLQLRLLEGLSALPLDSVAEMTKVVTFIREWQGADNEIDL